MLPLVGSINLGIKFRKVDFPEPLLPTKTKFSLAFILIFRESKDFTLLS